MYTYCWPLQTDASSNALSFLYRGIVKAGGGGGGSCSPSLSCVLLSLDIEGAALYCACCHEGHGGGGLMRVSVEQCSKAL